MERILIIGIQGSGKSTFANKLGKKLNREVIHLDKHYYPHPHRWEHTQTKEEWRETVRNLTLKERWIMDGNYLSTLDLRVVRADTIIFFKFNKIFCLYNALKRSFDKSQPFDKAEGNLNQISFDLVKKIITYNKKKVLDMLEPHKNTKKIFVLENRKEANKLLEKLSA